ncbi:hypothetical protein A2U01_0112786 [Trifolium medium]|uniref:Uncharacterized protein n=1 Tax=Trifolium medium TaxID=97028 RepID=A0A392VVL2_9FABA|nr:hypothetical protein [Trifolium medium]
MLIIPVSAVTLWLDIATVEQRHVALDQPAIWPCSTPMRTVFDVESCSTPMRTVLDT